MMRNRFAGILLLALGTLLTQPSAAYATHAGGGTCKHEGGLYSICKVRSVRDKKCTIDGDPGRCVQYAAGCFCVRNKALEADGAVADLRSAFDIVLKSADLPASGVPMALACQQVQSLTAHMARAIPVLDDFAADASFVGTEFLNALDSLLRDLPDVDAVAVSCTEVVPAGLQAALTNAKASYLPIIDALD